MKNKFVQFWFFMPLLVGLFSGCAKGPGIQFGSEKYDFGNVKEGRIINHVFEFTNNGTETLIIRGVVATCGCTRVEDFDREVQPGKSGKIPTLLNTKGINGKVTKNILIGTNVPDRTNISLTIEGTVTASPRADSPDKVGSDDK